MSAFLIKPGATFRIPSVYREDGVPTSLAGVTLKSQVRNDTGFSATLNISVTNEAAGEFVITGDTSLWPRGLMYWDVKSTESDETRFSETIEFEVDRVATQI